MNFSVIGLGSFGIKRAQSIKDSTNAKLININDTNPEIADKASVLLGVPNVEYEVTFYVFALQINFIKI